MTREQPQGKADLQEHTKVSDSEIVRKVLQAIGNPPREVYAPSDDSFLILNSIPACTMAGKTVLDLGTGSGILGLYCTMHRALVTVSDIDELALQHTRKAADLLGAELNYVKSDIFSNIHESYDFVLFNPPYLPSVTVKDKTVDGGPMGTDLIRRFLQELPNHLKNDGAAFLLVSSLNNTLAFINEHSEFDCCQVANRRLFFEELQVLRVRVRNSLARQ
jgi:release factor glutamine methyltransferase